MDEHAYELILNTGQIITLILLGVYFLHIGARAIWDRTIASLSESGHDKSTLARLFGQRGQPGPK